MKTINLNDPAVRRVLKRIASENRSDPFAVPRAISRFTHGIVDISELASKKQLPSLA